MLSNKIADIISARVCNLCGGNILPEKLIALSISELRKTGLSLAKAKYIHGIAQLCCDAPNFFTALANKTDNDVIKELKKAAWRRVVVGKNVFNFCFGQAGHIAI